MGVVSECGVGRAVCVVVGAEEGRLRVMVEHAALYWALQGLDARDRLVIQRRFYDGFSQAEVAVRAIAQPDAPVPAASATPTRPACGRSAVSR